MDPIVTTNVDRIKNACATHARIRGAFDLVVAFHRLTGNTRRGTQITRLAPIARIPVVARGVGGEVDAAAVGFIAGIIADDAAGVKRRASTDGHAAHGRIAMLGGAKQPIAASAVVGRVHATESSVAPVRRARNAIVDTAVSVPQVTFH